LDSSHARLGISTMLHDFHIRHSSRRRPVVAY
jgi:hypothetical protein